MIGAVFSFLSLVGKPIVNAFVNRRNNKSLLEKLALHHEGTLEIKEEETRAWTLKNLRHSWSDEYILLFYTGMLAYAAFGCPWGGDPALIKEMLSDPVLMSLIGAIYGIKKIGG